jgi:glyoxalase family protein
MAILGIHHISTICTDAQRTTDFYTQILGMHLVKKTVDFNAPNHYHLYFGDSHANPSTLVTCIEEPGREHGHPGIGGTHHFALIVESVQAQLKWKRRLMDLGIAIIGPYNRVYFNSIYFHDPDGTILEMATRMPGFVVDEPAAELGQNLRIPPLECMDGHRDEAAIAALTWPEPVPIITPDMKLAGLHHITVIGSDIEKTTEFYSGHLNVPLVKRTVNFDDPKSPHYYYALKLGEPGTIITYFERDPAHQLPVKPGAGQTHHFALNVAGDKELHEIQENLRSAGIMASDVTNHKYYKSFQIHDPFGHLVEIATTVPGFSSDESLSELGTHLELPEWLERDRDQIESNLMPLNLRIEERQ